MAKRITEINVLNSVAEIFIILLLFGIGFGLPTKERPNKEDNSTTEMTYPNGTVVGKYSYVDKEGNPVEVKYYADDSSYGVELNTVKIIKSHGSTFDPLAAEDKAVADVNVKTGKEDVRVPNKAKQEGSIFETFKSVYTQNNAATGDKNIEMKSESASDDTITATPSLQKYQHRSSDYDIYMPHDVPYHNMQCGGSNEKIHVYNFEKEFRSLPDTAEDESQYCDELIN